MPFYAVMRSWTLLPPFGWLIRSCVYIYQLHKKVLGNTVFSQAISEFSGASSNFHEDLLHGGERDTETREPQTTPLLCVCVCVCVCACVCVIY